MLISQYRGLPKPIYVIFLARMITAMGAFIWPLLTLILTLKVGLSDQMVGKIFFFSSFLFLIASVIGGKLVDRFGRKKIIIICELLVVLLFFVCAIIPPSLTLAGLIYLAGVISTIQDPAHGSLIADLTTPEQREKAFSLGYMGFNLGFIIGPTIGGILFKNHLNLAFFIDGLTTLISLTLFIIFVPETKPNKSTEAVSEEVTTNEYELDEDHKSTFRILLERKTVTIYFLLSIFSAFLYANWSFTVPLYLKELFKEDGASYYGYLSSLNGFVVILCTPVFTKLLSKVFQLSKFSIGVLLEAIGLGLFIINPHFLLFFIGITIFTMGEVVNSIAFGPFVSHRIPRSHRGRINGIVPIMGNIGHSITPLLVVSLLTIVTYQQLWTIILIFGFVLSLSYVIVKKYDKILFPNLYK